MGTFESCGDAALRDAGSGHRGWAGGVSAFLVSVMLCAQPDPTKPISGGRTPMGCM